MGNEVVDVNVDNGTVSMESTGTAAPVVASVSDNVCSVYVIASNGKPIANMQIVDKANGTSTPVNVATCAEAVACSKGIPVEVHLQTLHAHVDDTGRHLSAEEKAAIETKEGAQAKATAAQTAAYTAASLLVQTAKTELSKDATQKANAARDAAYQSIDRVNEDLERHMENAANPHGVTAAQVGLGNVPNKSTNDLQPTYAEAGGLEPLTSGERLAVAFGKIAKAISTLISHIGNKANPHGVTPAQIGAAAASHNHDASAITKGTLDSDRLPTIPMMVDVEYATTERFMGKVVYVKLISVGNLPSNGTKTVAHGLAATQIIRACGQASNGMAFPIGTGGSGFYYIGLRVGLKEIDIYCDTSSYASCTATVQLWYTKD